MDPKDDKVQNGTDNPSDSPNLPADDGGKKIEDQGTPPSPENKKEDAKPNPDFHNDPAVQEYLDRQWSNREAKLREEFDAKYGKKPDQDPSADEIPGWFGGDAKQWKDYQAHLANTAKDTEERAYQKFKSERDAVDKAQKDANEWFESEIKAIETSAKTTIDRNKLLELVVKHELVDSKGRWNYKAAYEILKGATSTQDPNKDRKKLADSTTQDGGGGEPESKTYKTSEDFRKERPW